MTVERITIAEYHARLKAQNVSAREHIASVCPMCGTVQSFRSLIAAGAGATEEEVEKFHSFSCIGRFTGAATPRAKRDGKPCNWTLGGLFQCHELVVLTDDGEPHPRFVPATAEQAQALERSWANAPMMAKVEE